MSKKYIAMAFLMATALAFLAFLLVVSALPDMAMSPDGAATLTDAQRADADHLGIAAVVCALASIIFDLIAWIGALLATAKRNKWIWFVCILLFNWPAILIYVLVPDQTTYLGHHSDSEKNEFSRPSERVIE